MPIPIPNKDETQKAFISRCMGAETMVKEYPDGEQRVAICYGEWKRKEEQEMRDNKEQATLNARAVKGYKVRYETFEGRRYIVAPVTPIVEGVHHGSVGPVYYPGDQLGDTPKAWNGIPLTYGHPMKDGKFSDVNVPEVLEEFGLGRFFGAYFDPEAGGEGVPGLRGEVWVDIGRANILSPGLIKRMQEGKPIEVSAGLFFSPVKVAGSWNGEDYEMEVSFVRPEHIAILPDSLGACSVSDGCGIRNEGGTKGGEKEMTIRERFKALLSVLGKDPEEVRREELYERVEMEKPGLLQLVRDIEVALKKMNEGDVWHFVEEVFDNGSFIMRRSSKEGTPQLFKAAYTVDEAGHVSIGQTFREVREERNFIELQAGETGGGGGSDQKEGETRQAEWTTAYVNDLPDMAFAIILPGGGKDEGGKTTPRSLRKFPHHNKEVKSTTEDSSVDLPHLRNALARLPQSNLTSAQKAKVLSHLKVHAKAMGEEETKQERKEEKTMTKEEIVQALIDCEQLHFSETHRETLMGLNEEVLGKLGDVGEGGPCKDEEIKNEGIEEPLSEGKKEEPPEETPKTLQEFVESAPEEHREILLEMVRNHDENKAAAVKALLAHARNKFTGEQLQAKTVGELKTLLELAGEETKVFFGVRPSMGTTSEEQEAGKKVENILRHPGYDN